MRAEYTVRKIHWIIYIILLGPQEWIIILKYQKLLKFLKEYAHVLFFKGEFLIVVELLYDSKFFLSSFVFLE